MSDCLLVKPSIFFGNIIIPPSKSHTMRAILSASLCKGKSVVYNILPSKDTDLMIDICISFGAKIQRNANNLFIEGVAGVIKFKSTKLYVGNSGIIYRFITAIAALDTQWIEIDGDDSIRNNRIIKPLLDSLSSMGAQVSFLDKVNCAPFKIKGPIEIENTSIDCIESQPISSLMWLSIVREVDFCITVENCQEWSWIIFTKKWLEFLNVDIVIKKNKVFIFSKNIANAFNFSVSGDFSTALFPIVATVITKGNLSIKGLVKSDWQGDKAVLTNLIDLGVDIKWNNDLLEVNGKNQYLGGVIDMQYSIDSIPIIVVLAIFAKEKTVLLNCNSARFKESDRLSVMISILNKLSVNYKLLGDDLEIYPSNINSEKMSFSSYNDHRIALSLMVLGLKTCLVIKDFACIEKTYFNVVDSWRKCNVDLQIINE